MILEIAVFGSVVAIMVWLVIGFISETSLRSSWQVSWRVVLNAVTIILGLWAFIAAESMLHHVDRTSLYLIVSGGIAALIAAIAVPWSTDRWLFRHKR